MHFANERWLKRIIVFSARVKYLSSLNYHDLSCERVITVFIYLLVVLLCNKMKVYCCVFSV